MRRILTTMAIYVGIGPLVGMALALNWIMPGGQSSLRDLFDIATLSYMFGGPFAGLTGVVALFLKRYGAIAYIGGISVVAALLGLVFGWYAALFCFIAALVCALLDARLNPLTDKASLPPPHE